MKPPSDTRPGVYGKMPSNGDFVTRRLPASFIEPWDQWLREAVSDSRDQLGERWLENYLTSPVWRFTLSPGTAGELAWAGVLIPSVDRVGRYFPLTLACAIAASSNPVEIMSRAQSWYDSAERLILSCLEDEFDLAGFDRQVEELGAPQGNGPSAALPPGSPTHRRMPLPEHPGDVCPELLRHALGELLFAFSLWWSRGSELVDPSLLVCQGLPPSRGFAAMLTGDWERWGWGQARDGERREDRTGGGTS